VIYEKLDGTHNPPKGDFANFWAEYKAASDFLKEKVDAAIKASKIADDGRSRMQRDAVPVFSSVGREWRSKHDQPMASDEARLAEYVEQEAFARRMCQQLDTSEFLALLDKLTEARDARRPVGPQTSRAPHERMTFEYERVEYRVSEQRIASAYIARERGDDAAFMRATEHALAYAHTLSKSSRAWDQTRTLGLNDLLSDMLRGAIMDKAENGTITHEWINQLRELLNEYRPPDDLSHALELLKESSLETNAWIFEDPSSVRFSRIAPGERVKAFDPQQHTMNGTRSAVTWRERLAFSAGSFTENHDVIRSHYDFMLHTYKTSGSLTSQRYQQMPDIARRIIGPDNNWFYGDWSRIAFNVRILDCMLALEAFRLDTKRYPTHLGELFPKYLDVFPGEGTWRGPVLYTLRSGPDDAQLRSSSDTSLAAGYVLYLKGQDNIDNGGVPTDKPWWDPNYQAKPGTDFVLSRTSYRRIGKPQIQDAAPRK
jgi:hypothetical protein